jgi:DUF1365 family protein
MEPMLSALYEAEVMHQRFAPARRFAHRVFYLWLDLAELPWLDADLVCFGFNHFALMSVHDADVIDGRRLGLRQALVEQWALAGLRLEDSDRIGMLAFPHVLGYGYNPVRFFFAQDQTGRPLAAMAQVTNTFGERKAFVALDWEQRRGGFVLRCPKHFYVSPFFPLDVDFEFVLRPPGDCVDIEVHDYRGQDHLLATRLSGRRLEINDLSLLKAFVCHPLVTLRVMFLIHWHALRLWWMGLAVASKADNPHLQTQVHEAHHSIRPTSVS